MKTLEWKFEDRRRELWLSRATDRNGPWDQEPDKRQWEDATTGLPCLIVRNHHGALCGYVGVPKSHPWYGVEYGDVEVRMTHAALIEDVEIPHGGLSFSGKCGERICHEVEPGEDDDVWWLGFDCAHSFDLIPGMGNYNDDTPCTYRDVAYVTEECKKLAAKAAMLTAVHDVQGA